MYVGIDNILKIFVHAKLARNQAKVVYEWYCQVQQGYDLHNEHDRYLIEKVFRGNSMIVTNYPKVKGLYHHIIQNAGNNNFHSFKC